MNSWSWNETTGPTCKRHRRPQPEENLPDQSQRGDGYFRHWQSSCRRLAVGVVPVSKTLSLTSSIPSSTGADHCGEDRRLAWGPDLEDGRHMLYVMSDNDLNPALATQIYAFAISASLLNSFKRQILPEPLYPPGQVKKALRRQSGFESAMCQCRCRCCGLISKPESRHKAGRTDHSGRAPRSCLEA